MPDDLELPAWVSEQHGSLPPHEAPVVRRSDLRGASEEQRRAAAKGKSLGRAGHHEPRPSTQPEAHLTARAERHEPVLMTRADRRRQREAHSRGAAARRAPIVEMVPPAPADEPRRSRRQEPVSRRHRPRTTMVRRRLVAALVLTSTLAVLLWTVWPSGDSSSPGRDTADLTAVAVARASSDPTAAAEDPPPSPTIAPTPGRRTVPAAGSGRLTSVALPAIAAPTVNPTRTIRVGLRVEQGAGVSATEASHIISRTLGDTRGWQTRDRVRFRAVSPAAMAQGDVDITIVLASPKLTDTLCKPLKTRGEVSCFNLRRVVLNVRRWTEGVPGYGNDLAAYRQYMVNHEIGHGLYHGHVECPRAGALAPIMLQQTKGLDGCKPNAWPTAP